MPDIMKPVWVFQKISSFSVQQIEEVVFAIDEGSFSGNDMPFLYANQTSCHIKEENGRYVVHFHDGHKEFVTTDTSRHQLIMQGEWWYRGVYTFTQEEDYTKITYEIFNIAQTARWIASLMILPEKTTHEKRFHDFVRRIEAVIK
ncbi:hypothetical protein [Emticicia sp. C21]|uniref:hypothetical protein n=1 Tax=Emticicia sp. C21 TaxID=2302915 RepID=UPI000E345040|nr:hypothetical protein [Emticicia sp. C21]RFS17634.1 hypothetical protein D0T08_07665 [Emticicia sp. C21]